jgi:hypothetical protein
MTVEFNHDEVMKMFRAKQKKFLTMTGHQGVAIAAEQRGRDGKIHWDTGTSANEKDFEFVDQDTINITAGTDYDIYLENKFGIMAIMKDKLKSYMTKFMEFVFNG